MIHTDTSTDTDTEALTDDLPVSGSAEAGAGAAATEAKTRAAARAEFHRDLCAGLSHSERSVSPKYFYDAAGSALFDQICELPEYYPTRTELQILQRHGAEMTQHMPAHAELIEFGAGSLTKVRLLLDAFPAERMPSVFLPVDISGAHLEQSARSLRQQYPGLRVQPVVADYTASLPLPPSQARPDGSKGGQRIGFFPGSTLGNFHPQEALAFLKRAAKMLRGGGLLIGLDLVKHPSRLHAAYNDSQGITAAFNLNVLRRANSELGADFDLDGFSHYAFYHPVLRRIEMHLVSLRAQTVSIGSDKFSFAEGETLHTESSYKFTVEGFRALAEVTGFRPGPVWTDPDRLFSVHWLQAPR